MVLQQDLLKQEKRSFVRHALPYLGDAVPDGAPLGALLPAQLPPHLDSLVWGDGALRVGDVRPPRLKPTNLWVHNGTSKLA